MPNFGGKAMDPLRANEILEVVREDHELVMENIQKMAELRAAPDLGDPQHLDRCLTLLREVARFFQMKLLPHFESEEKGLFLMLREHLPKGSTLVYELEAEHERLRQMCERLCAEVALLRHERQRRTALFTELQELCGSIAELLQQHADRETGLLETYGPIAAPQVSTKEVAILP
jgi:hemerythrin-like domain-containing protein